MTNIELRFSGYANFKEVEAQVAALQGQFATLNKEIQKSAFTGNATTNGANYAKQAAGLQVLHKAYGQALASSGAFEVSQASIKSDTQEYIKNLKAQKLGLMDVLRARNLSNRAFAEQMRLQRMSVNDAGTSISGKRMVTLSAPTAPLAADLNNSANRARMLAAEMQSASTKMINFGKNSTWSGRQLSMGFTAPLVAFGAISGKFAYDVNKNLTSIAKVYDTTSNLMGTASQKEAQRQTELNQLRNDGLTTAMTVAKNYGLTAKSTLDVQGQLAAAGQKGAALQQNTIAVQRFATLGELDYQKAVTSSIALQSTYKMSSDELAQSIDYMNAVENSTSLSMEDFATAIPIAAGPIKALGGSVKDLGTLMTAMKERGIDAAEGANALKSGLTRLYRPSQQVQAEFTQLTGKSLPELTAQAKGELIPLLQSVGAAIKNLDPAEKTKALAGLFGTYQRAKLGALLDGLDDMKNGIGQTAKAAEIARNTIEENAAIANGEMAQLTQSASGKFRIAMATLQLQLAETGKRFLTMGTMALTGISKLISGFNHLPKFVKVLLEMGVVLPALAGPLLMVLGLSTQLVGQGLRAASALTMIGTKGRSAFSLMTKEEKAAATITEALNNGLATQATQAEAAAAELKIIAAALAEATAAQQKFFAATEASNGALAGQAAGAAGTGKRGTNPYTPMTGSYLAWEKRNPAPPRPVQPRDASGKFASPNAAARAAEQAALKEQQATQASLLASDQKRADTIRRMGVGTTAMTASMLLMIAPTGKVGHEFGKWLLLLTLAVPLVSSLYSGLLLLPGLIMKMTMRMAAFVTMQNVQTAGAVGMKARMASIASLMGGPVTIGIAAAAAGAYLLYKHMHKVNEQIKAIHTDAKGLGDIFGFTAKETAPNVVPKAQKANALLEEQANKLNKTYPKLKGYINDATNAQTKFNRAAEQGFKAFNAGASEEQAKQVVTAALVAAGKTAEQAKEIVLKFGFDPKNVDAQVKNINNIMQANIEGSNKRGFISRNNPFAGHAGSSSTGESTGKQAGAIVSGLIQKGDSEQAKIELDKIVKQFNIARDKIANGGDRKAFTKSFVDNLTKGLGGTDADIKKMYQAITGQKNSGLAETDLETKGSLDIAKAILGMNTSLAATYKDQLAVKKTMNAVDMAIQSLSFRDAANNGMITTAQAKRNKEAQAALMALKAGDPITKNQLSMLYQMASENSDINDLIDYRNANGGIQISQIQAQNSGLQQQLALNKNILSVVGATAGASSQPDFAGKSAAMYQSAMTSAWSSVGSAMSSAVDASFAGRLNGMQAAATRAQDALDAHQKKAQDALDARQKKEEDHLEASYKKRKDALTKIENLRQKTFDAEMNRIEREKNARNSDVDYQTAVASGQLDQAAKIRNDATAQGDMDRMNDANDSAKAAYDAKEALLDAAEEKAKARLQKRQQAEKAAQQASQAREKSAMAAQQQAAQANAQRLNDINKAKIQSMLAADLAYVPTTEASAKKHIAEMVVKYQKMGIDLSSMSKQYGNTLHSELMNNLVKSANDLKSQVDWAGIAKSAVTKAVRAAWGMSLSKFLGWVDAPGTASAGETKKATGKTTNHMGADVHHGGGFVGAGGTGRAGYSMSASPYPSEQMVLAKRGEYIINDKAARRIGPAILSEMNNVHLKGNIRTDVAKRNTGGIGGGFNRAIDAASLGAAITKPYAKIVKSLGDKKKAQMQIDKLGMASGADFKISGDGSKWLRPWIKKYAQTQGPHDYNGAIDFGVPSGTKLYAPSKGIVTRSYDIPADGRVSNGGFGSYGRAIETAHEDGIKVFMAHLSQRGIKSGQNVNKGTFLGKSGNTGHSFGPHVHASATQHGRSVDIRSVFAKHGVSLRKGGELKYDNTLVQGHKDETMLTAGLTDHFKTGVENFAKAKPGNTFGDIKVTVPAGIENPKAFGRAVAMEIKKELDYEESRY